VKAISLALLLAAAVALAPGEAAAHHGKKEEHAQPAAARGGCTWARAGRTYKTLEACMKGTRGKGECRSTCK
jgi:hypothetical protein